jgi:diguanylate cyclase (GGDEF)-like protein
LRSSALQDVYTPTEPPGSSRLQLDTPVFGLSERPEPYAVRDRAGLVRLDGAMAGEVHSLVEGTVTVGRDQQSVLQIDDVSVSRQHAEIFHEQGAWWVKDAGSCNGTYLDGGAVELRQLLDDCIVRFGPVASFRFQLMDESHEATLKRLFETSHRDALTGGHNRRYFTDRLSVELAFAIRHDTMLSVVLLDIDRFKHINDTYGHIVGDAVLRHAAQTVRGQLRREDLFARYGGEEFVLLLRDIEVLGAAVVAERVRAKVEATPLHLDDYSISVTLSAGCATLEECDRPTAEGLLSLADSRLYEAKRAGRNRVVLK